MIMKTYKKKSSLIDDDSYQIQEGEVVLSNQNQ